MTDRKQNKGNNKYLKENQNSIIITHILLHTKMVRIASFGKTRCPVRREARMDRLGDEESGGRVSRQKAQGLRLGFIVLE